MAQEDIRRAAEQCIRGFDLGAHRAITGWRTGGDRLGRAARARWDRAFAESSPQLSAETRRNASHLRDVVARRYARGIELTAAGAERAVGTVVQAAQAALAGRMPR
jgi:hypothetical protein